MKAYLSVPQQLERVDVSGEWLTVHMAGKLVSRIAAKNEGVAARLDVRDCLLYLTWNFRIADRLANV